METRVAVATSADRRSRLGVVAPVVLGIGLGAFVDGIVLQQLLQWHHLVSSRETDATLAGLETNTFWDGVFHAAAWLVTAVGLVLLVASHRLGARPRSRTLVGLALVGWGLFNMADQLVFHLALGAHHIRETDDYAVYDWSFFALGVALMAAGGLIARDRSEQGLGERHPG